MIFTLWCKRTESISSMDNTHKWDFKLSGVGKQKGKKQQNSQRQSFLTLFTCILHTCKVGSPSRKCAQVGEGHGQKTWFTIVLLLLQQFTPLQSRSIMVPITKWLYFSPTVQFYKITTYSIGQCRTEPRHTMLLNSLFCNQSHKWWALGQASSGYSDWMFFRLLSPFSRLLASHDGTYFPYKHLSSLLGDDTGWAHSTEQHLNARKEIQWLLSGAGFKEKAKEGSQCILFRIQKTTGVKIALRSLGCVFFHFCSSMKTFSGKNWVTKSPIGLMPAAFDPIFINVVILSHRPLCL